MFSRLCEVFSLGLIILVVIQLLEHDDLIIMQT